MSDEEKEELVKTIDRYESKVQELTEIRKVVYDICGDLSQGCDAYFPDLVRKELKRLKIIESQ